MNKYLNIPKTTYILSEVVFVLVKAQFKIRCWCFHIIVPIVWIFCLSSQSPQQCFHIIVPIVWIFFAHRPHDCPNRDDYVFPHNHPDCLDLLPIIPVIWAVFPYNHSKRFGSFAHHPSYLGSVSILSSRLFGSFAHHPSYPSSDNVTVPIVWIFC